MTPVRSIDAIDVGLRYRQDLGDLRSLAQSIGEVGLLHPIVITPEGRLIAGQRRVEACRQLGWTEVPVTVVDLLQAARGEAHENFVRKDLLPSEIVALKRAIEPLERREARARQGSRMDLGTSTTTAEGQGEARDKIARYLGVGRTTIDRAEAVLEAAEDDPEGFGHLVEQMDRSGKVAGAFRRLTVMKQARKLEVQRPELPTGPFQVVVADPPWRYESGSDLPYPTLSIEEIKGLPVRNLADENAILWLWTTNAHLRVAFEVVESWGFEYKTLLTWVKDRMGTGEWLRGKTEHCLLGARGKPVFLHGSDTTALEATRREHSRKPAEFYALVERICPGGRIDLFSRQQREGWCTYGDQTRQFNLAAGQMERTPSS
ncbi:MT-A70 family methyltransferase [Paludibaculum fermentans]|uniref:MT-A70 family methyltransferase n=1 Tax=Paludibaculum fermentans TaxID=1473598 RepID=UPI003EB94462